MKTIGSVAASATALSTLPGCTLASHSLSSKTKPPNIILVITDDQGYGDLACHGNPVIKTPNLDELYRRSVRLTNFHVGPTCSPTRAALMTGRYCNRTGVWHTIMGRSLLRKDEVTIADIFSDAGYRTAIFGKWHLGDNYPFRPHDRGFAEALVHGGGAIGNTPDYWGNDYFDDTYYHNGRPEKFKGYCTDVWFEQAMKFIEANRNRPFFCYLPTNAAHGPYRVPERYTRLYGDNKNVNPNFYGMITNIDDNIGWLTAQLKQLGIENNTILIFMTDNGTSAGRTVCNAGMRGQKGSEYDGGHRVPCFIRYPAAGIKAGTDADRLTAHVDLLPTLIELCGINAAAAVNLDGSSLVPLLTANPDNWPSRTLITDSQRIDHPKKWRKSAVMTDRWRLVNGRELYDINTDPGQKQNLADKHPNIVAELRRDYEKWWEDVSKRFDEYCEIIVGSDYENPTRLTTHDWHADGPWDQTQISKNNRPNNGFWALQVARPGNYRISLRRWPKEVNAPITAAIPGGKAIKATTARLKIAGFDLTQPIREDTTAATFTLKLKPGKTRLQTWFTDDNGASLGAYYVYVKRI